MFEPLLQHGLLTKTDFTICLFLIEQIIWALLQNRDQVPEVICNGESGSWRKVKFNPHKKKSRLIRHCNHKYSALVSEPSSVSRVPERHRKTVKNDATKRGRDKNMNEFPAKDDKKPGKQHDITGNWDEQTEKVLNNNGILESEFFWDDEIMTSGGNNHSCEEEKQKSMEGSGSTSEENSDEGEIEGGYYDDDALDVDDSLHTICTACTKPSVLSFHPCIKIRSQSLFTMSALSLTLLIFYVFIGTLMFHSIEQQGSVRVTSENDFLLFDFIQEWMERTYNAEYSNMTEFLTGALTQLRSNSSELEKFWESKLGKETIWTWPNALFYTFTVVTTIGEHV